jgi:Derlin-2/3
MDLEGWLHNVPIVTKCFMFAAAAVSVAVTFEIATPLDLYLNHTAVWQRGQYWRLVTNFLFFGSLDIGFFFNMHFLYFYCRRLEEHFYFNRTGEFLFLVVTAAATLTGISFYVSQVSFFLAQPLIMVILYLWARRFPDELLNIYGLFNVTSAYLPFVMVGFAYLLNGKDSAKVDLYGLLVGHVLWYLADVFPQITGWHPMSPSFFTGLFARQRHHVD